MVLSKRKKSIGNRSAKRKTVAKKRTQSKQHRTAKRGKSAKRVKSAALKLVRSATAKNKKAALRAIVATL